MPSFSNVQADLPEEDTLSGRLDRWQRKLLDLSARNPLLNHKPGKTSLTFICGEPGALEDVLASGARISIAPFPKFKSQDQDEDIYRQRTGQDLKEEYAKDALSKNQILVDLNQEELDKRAVEIYRKAQTSLKEGGSNTLFLAVGFLYWKQKEKEDRRYRAPLILLPVSLERKSVRSGVKIIASDDDGVNDGFEPGLEDSPASRLPKIAPNPVPRTLANRSVASPRLTSCRFNSTRADIASVSSGRLPPGWPGGSSSNPSSGYWHPHQPGYVQQSPHIPQKILTWLNLARLLWCDSSIQMQPQADS